MTRTLKYEITETRRTSSARISATIKDVAARANVSVATVSRVLNRTGLVQHDTSLRVTLAIQALQYVPHAVARSLSIRRTNTIGVLLPDLYGEFFSEVIRGIDAAARRHGYHLLVSGSHSDSQEMTAMLAAVRGHVDGLIVMSPELDGADLCSRLRETQPVVLLNCMPRIGSAITIDNEGGSRSMVEHLTSLGHRRIAFIKGPEANSDAAERLRGFRDATARAGVSDQQFELDGDFSESAGYEAARAILALDPRPTAVFAANDAMAIGALCAFRELGLRVPEDIVVTGFDDIPIARYVTPPLTTVSVAIAQLGRRAFELLLEALAEGPGESDGRREILPTTLVVRHSCGALATGQGRRLPIQEVT
ncbi:MAG TPA: LacI family DNA-binding transcriptional regulator [Thermoanaerobaculia bacterium]|nr:LacI family DNA-binding transcriptional regulator [Thermoanaerobaculia bacterium]